MRAHVRVTLRPGLLDPEARAVHASLQHLGFDEVEAVVIARTFTLELPDGTPVERVQAMARDLLANPVLDDVSIAIDEDPPCA